MPPSRDPKVEACVSFINYLLDCKYQLYPPDADPAADEDLVVVGLSGCQGSGKSTLVIDIQRELQSSYQTYVVVISIDDLYLTHEAQVELAQQHADNPLVQHRGQPSTHDLALATEVLENLHTGKVTSLPVYDKSAFNGAGDRAPRSQWRKVNEKGTPRTTVVLVEGWCVGFKAISPDSLESQWQQARGMAQNDSTYHGRLGLIELQHIEFINTALKKYDIFTDHFDGLIHLDAVNSLKVYDWRLEQEHDLRARRGSGMTDAEVREFVNGYYPSYELYTENLRRGVWPGAERQLRIVIDDDRKFMREQII